MWKCFLGDLKYEAPYAAGDQNKGSIDNSWR